MPQLQNLFRQRYSKLGNTHEQLFHAWRSFTFDENAETIDTYVICIRQVPTLLGYGEPQILEVFKNTLPTKLYWVLFPMENLRQAVDTAKRILTKEKLDKQLTGHTSTSPFMSIKDGMVRRVSFNNRDELGDKIDKLTVMMNRLVVRGTHEKRPFKPQIYKGRGQHRSYDQASYQSRLGSRNRGQFMDNRPRQNYRGNKFRGNTRGYSRKIIEEIMEMKGIMTIMGTEIGQEKEHLQEITEVTETEAQVIADRDSGSRAHTNGDRIRCYKCREYEHFARDCPNSREERDLEQLQQMLNMEEQNHRIESSDDDYRSPLNL